ncbi:MAG: long-chain fatty acid--CoA ligase [Thermoanaerobaculia bacterium]
MKDGFHSVPEMFLARVGETPDAPAFLYPRDPEWITLTWRQTGERVRAISAGLRALGVADEQRVAILSGTRIDWVLADLGILCAGAATTTIYPANTIEEFAYILNDSGAVAVFVENQDLLDRLAGERANLPQVKRVVLFEGVARPSDWVVTLEELEALGRERAAATPGEFEATIGRIAGDHLATLIYTSGTTGQPKGVELLHDAWVYEGEAITALDMISRDDVQYFWLPLAHVFGKVIEAAQVQIGFATAIDGRVDKLVDQLAVIRPTFLCAVPRIFERVYNKVVGQVQEAGGAKLAIFKWAVGVGRRVSALAQQGKRPAGWLAIEHRIADALVFRKLRARFGGRVRFFISGSAPLSREMAEFFHACGLLILEGYGLTESSAASCVNRERDYRFGTVGQALPGTELRIAEEDGEILLRGRGIMRGYRGLPEATAAALDAGGWLHTGDIGEVDAQGFLRITDRKKDLIKTSVGKYVAPQVLEGKLRMESRFISQAVIHGNNRAFVSALITINHDELRTWASERGLAHLPYGELARHDETRQLVGSVVERVNRGLPKHEQIRKFELLPQDFAVETGELTPSLKVKRRVVETKYREVLEGLYKEAVERI